MGFMDKAKKMASETLSSTQKAAMDSVSDARKGFDSSVSAVTSEFKRSDNAIEEGALLEVTSHDKGQKNAQVRVYPDRIEMRRNRGMSSAKMKTAALTLGTSLAVTGIRGNNDAFDMIFIRDVTGVQSTPDGMLFRKVEVASSGNTISFRVSRDEAEQFRRLVMQLSTDFHQPQASRHSETPMPAAPPATPASTPHSGVSDADAAGIAEQIKQLLDLHAAGILTDDEFSAKKAELLSRM